MLQVQSGPAPRTSRRRFLRGVAALLVVLVAALVLAELAAQVWIERFADVKAFGRFASLSQVLERQGGLVPLVRHRYLGYYPNPDARIGDNHHNSLGFRGPELAREKPEGTFRIACIGGSTTYGAGVKDSNLSYPALLERELRARGHAAVEVLNAGCNGWCAAESLINLELRVLELEPDLLLILHSANDIHARFVWPPEHYLGDNSGFRVATTELILPNVFEHSALYRIVAVSNGWMTPHSGIERSLSVAPPWSYATLFRVQTSNQRYPRGFFLEVSADEMLRVNEPVHYRRNLESMLHLAERRGIEAVLCTFVYNDFYPGSLSASPTYVAAFAEHDEVLREIAAAEGVRLFDLRAAMPVEREYFTDDIHMTEAGNRVKARLYADYLEAEGLVR